MRFNILANGNMISLAEYDGIMFAETGFIGDESMYGCSVRDREVGSIARSRDPVRAFRALGQETRFKILDLVSSKAFSVGELGKQLGVSQSAISQQLKVLQEAGLVRLRREGKYTLCSMNHSLLEEVRNLIDMLLEGKHMFGL
jgi:DNA-binding transcriptional ArsR family regulator